MIQERKHFSDEQNIWNIIGYWREVMKIKILFAEKEYYVGIDNYINQQYTFEIEGKNYYAILKENFEGKLAFVLDGDFYTTYISEDPKDNAFLSYNGHIFSLIRKDILSKDNSTFRLEDFVADTNTITSPMPGKVIKINVTEGSKVKKGETIIIIEAMKMENRIFAPKDCTIQKVNVKVGEMVESSVGLISLE